MKLDKKLNSIDTYPFHMPGHKRNTKFNIPCSDIDITETDGFDNLHKPEDVLKKLQEDIADTFGYKKSIISVNGSTCGILSAICAVCSKGDKIIIARNCHKSVYNACFLNELDVIYIEPEYNYEFGVYGRINQSSLDKAVSENPDAAAVVITSPTYEGIISEINCPIPLIVDAAHGAHFSFADWLPKKAVGDIVIQSLHKTLPSLTQTAVIHISNEKYYDKVKKYMDIFETSSPSYVLLDSIDKCVDFLKNSSDSFAKYKMLLDRFYKEADSMDSISVLKNDDITRIIISAYTMTGTQLADMLRNDFNIESEAATLNYVILISTIADTNEGFEMLINALRSIERKAACKKYLSKPALPKKIFKSNEIVQAAAVDINDSSGKISAEYIYAYPPGIPLIVPGEEISSGTIQTIKDMFVNGINIISDSDLLPLKILTKA